MTEKRATRRYMILFVPAMAVYLAGMLSISYAEKNLALGAPWLYLATMVPIAALLVWFWAQWRFIRELDEYLGLIQIKGLLFGLAVVLAFSASWGLLEELANVQRFPLIHILTIFCVCYGGATFYFTKRNGGDQA